MGYSFPQLSLRRARPARSLARHVSILNFRGVKSVMRSRFPFPSLFGILFAGSFALGTASPPTYGASGNAIAQALALPEASFMAEEAGRTVIAKNADQPMVPASTMKILTSLAAIQAWGLEHHFHTDFFHSPDGWLWVKGYGDPYLVSEELEHITQALKKRGLRSLAGIGTDDSYFAPDVEIAGRSSSNNPYDAPVSALAANFNTISVLNRGGIVRSAEAQTPLTPLARAFAERLGPGEHRVNLKERGVATRYFAEILAAKLRAAGIELGDEVRSGQVPAGLEQFYRHHNTRNLRTVLASMLEYSNNFVANDLFLLLGDPGGERSVSTEQAQRDFAAWVDKNFGWQGYRIEDGAGLSHGNRLTARQLLAAVKAFAPYRELLPKKNEGRVRAKTGTLTGVSCLAGFVQRHGRWEAFSLLINQPVAHDFRMRVADALASGPDLDAACAAC